MTGLFTLLYYGSTNDNEIRSITTVSVGIFVVKTFCGLLRISFYKKI